MDQDQKGLPRIMRETSNSRQNKLAKRLYKNNSMKKLNSTAQFSYLRNINPDSSILASTLGRNNSSKNLLIPSISLKRNKEMDNSQRSLQITQGKILLSKNQQPSFLHYKGDLKYQLHKTSSSNAKTLFKKIARYDGIKQKNIIPDELLGCSSDNQGSCGQSKFQKFQGSPKSKGQKILKGFKSQNTNAIEDQETLTPNDFIQLIQEDGTITNQFCYLKKMSHPYDLKIVQFQGNMNTFGNPGKTIKPSMIPLNEQYITISSRGVSYFSQENSRFVPLQRWKKEAFYFKKLMKLQFFSKYRLLKNFAKWKKHIRKTAMKSTTDKLRNELLIGDKFLRKALISIKDSCFIMQNDINYCKFDDCENVMEFQNFKSCQEQFIQNEFQKRIISIEEDIKNNLIQNMSDSMREFKEENKISTSSEGKGIPILIGDEKNLDMPYTKQATLRIQQQKFKKFLKLVEFMIVDSKIKMMNQSTQKTVKKIEQENQNYQKQVIDSKYKLPFKGKQYIRCAVKLNLSQQFIMLKPTRDDLNYMFEEIVNRAVVKLCRNHKRIINDDDILEIIYDSTQKIVKQPETNILKVIIMADDRQEKIVNMLNQAVNSSYNYLELYSNRFINLVQMYFDNMSKFQAINTYEAKDHQVIKLSLENWKNQLTQISSLSQQHESSIFLLDFQQFKNNAIKCVTQCFQKMKKVMPDIFAFTTQKLLNELANCQQKMKIKPVQIQDFIEFQKNKNDITNKMDTYSDQLAQINCISFIMKSYSSGSEMSNITRQQNKITSLQTKLNLLRSKIQQAQMNTKAYQTNAQQLLKARIPLIKDSIDHLYQKIKNSKFDVTSDINEVTKSISEHQDSHEKISNSIKQIKQFQQQLCMQEYNDPIMTKFTNYFTNYKQIWKLYKQMIQFQKDMMNQPWTTIDIEDAKKTIDIYFNEALKLKKIVTTISAEEENFKVQLNDIHVLSFVYLEAKNLKPLIQTIQCFRDKSLGQKQWKQIKNHFEKIQRPHVCQIIDIDNKQATIMAILENKVSEQLDFIQSVVFRSKKQMQIQHKMMQVNKFWVQNSNNNAIKNLTENFQDYYWNIITEIDQKITVINGISEDRQVQASQLKQNINQNKAMFDTLRTFLTEWQTHQRYLTYFEPIFKNSYWKSNNKESKLYLQAEGNWKKLLKQCKDYSLKRWAQNDKAIISLRQNIALFQTLKKVVEQFLTVKRDIFPKFYFLSNEELFHVLVFCEKQFRSIEEHLNKVFTCLKTLDSKQVGQIVVGTDSQILPVKFSKALNSMEIEEIFKMLEQSIKSSVRANLRNCVTNFEKDDFNRKKWIKDHLLQSLIFIQKSQYTKIIQQDYIGPDPQDISQYLIYQNSQIKQLQLYLKDYCHQAGLHVGKIQTLIMQQILHRQITQMLMKNHVKEVQSYEWQKQIRCYYSSQNACTQFFTNQIQYGYQFVNIESAYPYLLLSDRQAIDMTMALKLKHTPVIKGRTQLISNFCKFNAKYYRSVLCEKRISEKYLLNVCYGSYLEGCYVEFEGAQNLIANQISVIANFLKQIYSATNLKDKTFNFGWKKNPVNFNSGIIFKLSDTACISQFSTKLPIQSKSLEFRPITYSVYLNLIMQIRRKYTNKNLGSKLMKIIEITTQLEGYSIFNFTHVKAILDNDKMAQIQNIDAYFIQSILNIITEKITSAKKISFYRKILHQIFFETKNIAQSDVESTADKQKICKDKSDFKYLVNSLVQITDKKSLCIVAGPTQSGKVSLISEAYKQKICRGFEIEILNTDILDDFVLCGCYLNDLWKEGILIRKLKQLAFSKQQWIVFQGSYSEQIIQITRRLNQNYLQLSNGQIVYLSPQWKFIFSIYNLDQSCKNIPKNIEIISSNKFINTIEDSIDLMMQRRIKCHFQKDSQSKNLENFSQLCNQSIHNHEKLQNPLKTIGFKSQYLKLENILRYFVDIVDSLLSSIPIELKLNKEFSKGIQKIVIWSLYWCIGSGLPSGSANKYEKSLFESIKTQVDRSQNLSLLKLDFQNPSGNFKKIKSAQVKIVNKQIYMQTLDLKAKINFLQIVVKNSFPIILIGKTGSGKSKFLQYIQQSLNPDQYTYLPIKLRKQMSYEQFKDILFKKTRISIKYLKKKCFCSSTNKRLLIMIDDFNLLDLESQIGEFLMSWIKNGYYYDLANNEKIYIHNISLVVAQNETYEFRIENKFLKYFKPIYINEIQLRDIADVYKQEPTNISIIREIFDASVSLHNFVMNLQSNSQIRREFPFSHKNSIRIMECIKQYSRKTFTEQNSDTKENRQNLAQIWSYISKMQYTGYNISSQVEERIQKQAKNLLNLIIQNSNEKPKPVPYLSDLLVQLVNKNNLIKADGQYQSYYEYLAFLLTFSQPHNLLTIGQPLPQQIKSQILQQVAQIHNFKYFYIQNAQNLKTVEFKNSLIYLSTKNFDQLLKVMSFILNNSQCKQARYVLDCQNSQFFSKLIKFLPQIPSIFHIFMKKICLFNILIGPQYNQWIKKLEDFVQISISQRQIIGIISNLLKKQKFLKAEILKKKRLAQNFIEKYLRLEENIQKNIKSVQQFTHNIKQLQAEQQAEFMRKKQLNEIISNLKPPSKQDQDEEQKKLKAKQLKDQLSESQNQLKIKKAKKKDLSESVSNLQSLTKFYKQIHKKLIPHNDKYLEIKRNISTLEQSTNTIIFCLSLYYLGIKQKNKKYQQFIEFQISEKNFDFENCLKIIFDFKSTSINQQLLVWVMEEKSVVIIDKHRIFLRQVQKALQRFRIFNQPHSLNHPYMQPLFYHGKIDQNIPKLKQLTYIFKQEPSGDIKKLFNDKVWIQVDNNQQNQKYQMKANIYQQRQKDLALQIQNYEQQIHQLKMEALQEEDRIISQFLNPKDENLKNLRNLIYPQIDRLTPLYSCVQNIENLLDTKYYGIIEFSCLFKKIIKELQQQTNYFLFSSIKFEKIILQSIKVYPSGQKTRKRLLEPSIISKKSLNVIKSRKQIQIPTEKNIGKEIDQIQQGQKTVLKLEENEQSNPLSNSQEIKNTSQINTENFKAVMIDQLLRRITLGLKDEDFLKAYTLFAINLITHELGISPVHKQNIMKFLENKSIPLQNINESLQQIKLKLSLISESQTQSKKHTVLSSIKNLYKSSKQENWNSYEKIIDFANISLNTSFELLLQNKYELDLLGQKDSIFVISNPLENCFQILQKNILCNLVDSSWCYLFESQIHSQKIVQMAQKSSINFFVIVNNKNPIIYEQMKQIQLQKDLNFIFLYTDQKQFSQFRVKTQLSNKRHAQHFTIVYAQQSNFLFKKISNIYMNNFQKLAQERSQIQSLYRIVFYQQSTQFMHKILKQHQKSQYSTLNIGYEYYQTKVINEILNSLTNIPIISFIKVIYNLCLFGQKQKQNIFLKQAKKVVGKRQDLVNSFLLAFAQQLTNYDQSPFQGTTFVNQSTKTLAENFAFSTAQQIINMFVPVSHRKKFKIVDLYFQKSFIKDVNQFNKKAQAFPNNTIERLFEKIDGILNDLPNFGTLESQSNKKEKHYYKQIIREQIKIKVNKIKKIQQILKKYRKLIENPKIFSLSTQKQLLNIPSYILNTEKPNNVLINQLTFEQIIKYIQNQQNSIQYLQKFYQSKQNQKVFEPNHFDNPLSFIRLYLYDTTNKVNFINGQIQARFLTQKDKQAHFESSEQCKSLILNEVTVKYAKFDQNKNILEANEKNEPSKITSVHVCFNDKEILNLPSLVPIFFNNTKLVNLSVINKVKDDSVWKDKILLEVQPRSM